MSEALDNNAEVAGRLMVEFAGYQRRHRKRREKRISFVGVPFLRYNELIIDVLGAHRVNACVTRFRPHRIIYQSTFQCIFHQDRTEICAQMPILPIDRVFITLIFAQMPKLPSKIRRFFVSRESAQMPKMPMGIFISPGVAYPNAQNALSVVPPSWEL